MKRQRNSDVDAASADQKPTTSKSGAPPPTRARSSADAPLPTDFVDDNELLRTLHAAVFRTADDVTDEVVLTDGSIEGVHFDPEVVSRVTSLVWDTVVSDWTTDLLSFSQHGGRVAVNNDDVSLIMRRFPALSEAVQEQCGSGTTGTSTVESDGNSTAKRPRVTRRKNAKSTDSDARPSDALRGQGSPSHPLPNEQAKSDPLSATATPTPSTSKVPETVMLFDTPAVVTNHPVKHRLSTTSNFSDMHVSRATSTPLKGSAPALLGPAVTPISADPTITRLHGRGRSSFANAMNTILEEEVPSDNLIRDANGSFDLRDIGVSVKTACDARERRTGDVSMRSAAGRFENQSKIADLDDKKNLDDSFDDEICILTPPPTTNPSRRTDVDVELSTRLDINGKSKDQRARYSDSSDDSFDVDLDNEPLPPIAQILDNNGGTDLSDQYCEPSTSSSRPIPKKESSLPRRTAPTSVALDKQCVAHRTEKEGDSFAEEVDLDVTPPPKKQNSINQFSWSPDRDHNASSLTSTARKTAYVEPKKIAESVANQNTWKSGGFAAFSFDTCDLESQRDLKPAVTDMAAGDSSRADPALAVDSMVDIFSDDDFETSAKENASRPVSKIKIEQTSKRNERAAPAPSNITYVDDDFDETIPPQKYIPQAKAKPGSSRLGARNSAGQAQPPKRLSTHLSVNLGGQVDVDEDDFSDLD